MSFNIWLEESDLITDGEVRTIYAPQEGDVDPKPFVAKTSLLEVNMGSSRLNKLLGIVGKNIPDGGCGEFTTQDVSDVYLHLAQGKMPEMLHYGFGSILIIFAIATQKNLRVFFG